MATSEGFNGKEGGGFVHLLESGGLETGEGYATYPSFLSFEDPSKMLCFGRNETETGVTEAATDTSSTSSSSGGCSFFKTGRGEKREESKKPRNGSDDPGSGTRKNQKTCKKPRTEIPLRVRKEKLGERITALQQLVSPFGKTDTASVLHEAIGYIRFLHEQLQVLSSPYLSSALSPGGGEESMYDLRRRGLCLVPIASTVHVANSNGADFWSPAMGRSKPSSAR